MAIPVNKKNRSTNISERSRFLTSDEIILAKSIFGRKIRYSEVKIFKVEYLPKQEEKTIVTPNGNIYPSRAVYRDNYAIDSDSMKKLFIHEMAHVWQNHMGMNVLVQGAIVHTCAYLTGKNAYLYDIQKTKGTRTIRVKGSNGQTIPIVSNIYLNLSDYNLEAQAEIIADYWALGFKRNPILMMERNFEKNVKGKNLDEIIRIYKEKVRNGIGL